MAPLGAPGIDLQNLSSNWKALKATLPVKQSPPSFKRKRDDEEWTENVKRRKELNGQEDASSKAFGSHMRDRSMLQPRSRLSTKKPSRSLAALAAEHDIPVKDVTAAYGTSGQASTITENNAITIDRVNEGVRAGTEAGKYIAIDCEMVGVGPNPDKESALARISIVNYHGQQLYDSFVQTKEPVTDYRTYVSGITPSLMKGARPIEVVQADVSKLFQDRILVGHSLQNDLSALLLSQPKRDIRDTSKHAQYRAYAGGKTPSLKKLAKEILGIDIQRGEHSSLEDARATMLLFRHDKANFDLHHVAKHGQLPKRNNVPRGEHIKPSKKSAQSKQKKASKG